MQINPLFNNDDSKKSSDSLKSALDGFGKLISEVESLEKGKCTITPAERAKVNDYAKKIAKDMGFAEVVILVARENEVNTCVTRVYANSSLSAYGLMHKLEKY